MTLLNVAVRDLYNRLPPDRPRDSDIADAAGINRSHLCRWRQGKADLGLEKLDTLHARVWGISITELIQAHHNEPS